jgi:hypothetical protein
MTGSPDRRVPLRQDSANVCVPALRLPPEFSWLADVVRHQRLAQQQLEESLKPIRDAEARLAEWHRQQQEWLRKLGQHVSDVQDRVRELLRPMGDAFRWLDPALRVQAAPWLARLNELQVRASMQTASRPTLLGPDLLVSQSVLRMLAVLRQPLLSNALAEDLRLRVLLLRAPFELYRFSDTVLSAAAARNDASELRVAETAVEHSAALSETGMSALVEPLESIDLADRRQSKAPGSFPTYNLLDVHYEEIGAFARSRSGSPVNAEDLKGLPGPQIQHKTLVLLRLLLDCNRLCANAGIPEPFPPTSDIIEAVAVIPNLIAVDVATLRELVVHLYKLLYDGSGEAKRLLAQGDAATSPSRLSDGECEPLWDLKHLRNYWLVHDHEHGDSHKIREKREELGRFFRRVLGKASPTRSEDFKAIQIALIDGMCRMVRRLSDILAQSSALTS